MSTKFITETYSVRGMSCTGCESIIRRTLLRMDGVKSAEPDFARNVVEITYDPEQIIMGDIWEALKGEGYYLGYIGSGIGSDSRPGPVRSHAKGTGKGTARSDSSVRSDRSVRSDPRTEGSVKTASRESKSLSPLQFVGIVVALLAGYLIINNTIGFSFVPEITESMGYGMLFLIGLLTSLHCVAMCGGISMSQCMPKGAAPTSAKEKIKPSLLYNLGRVTSYTIIGGIIGALGSVLSFSGRARGAVAILAGVFMVIMGISMLGIFPWLNKFTPRLPRFLRRKAGAAGQGKGPFIVGLVNGFMPCGPLQAMQIYALGTGSFLTGALSMFFFSLGTLPLMFGLGVFIMFLGSKFTKWMIGVGAVLVVILGMIMFSRGAALAGFSMPGFDRASNVAAASAQVTEDVNTAADNGSDTNAVKKDVQYISSTMSANAYPDITVEKGIPVEWTIHADAGDINGCNRTMVIAAYGLEVKLEEGDNLIKFTPTETGNITYSCWMGMITAQIAVKEASAAASAQTQPDTTKPVVAAPPGEDAAIVQETSVPLGGCCGL